MGDDFFVVNLGNNAIDGTGISLINAISARSSAISFNSLAIASS
jgi:hypothetical protein